MSNMVEMSRAKTNQKTSTFEQNQRMARQMPGILRGLHEEMKTITHAVKKGDVSRREQTDLLKEQMALSERLHDRLDTLVAETRVTNVLLSELVALQSAVISEPVDDLREAIRNEAYVRISNGG